MLVEIKINSTTGFAMNCSPYRVRNRKMKGIAAQCIAHNVEAMNPIESSLIAKLCLKFFNILIANHLQSKIILFIFQLNYLFVLSLLLLRFKIRIKKLFFLL